MRVLNELLLSSVTVALGVTSGILPLDHIYAVDLMAMITGAVPANKTFLSGVLEVQTLTYAAKASTTNGDYMVIYDAAGLGWAVALDTLGTAAATPTGAIWTAIPAARKVYVDISATGTAATVAAAAKAAYNALTGFTAVLTLDDSAADGTMTSTAITRGPVTNPSPHTKNDSGAGSIAGVQTTGGVTSDVDLVGETAAITAHGFTTGLKVTLTTTTTLPTGLATSTDYYLIAASADLIKFATSQANALAGTAINLTGYGAGTHTVTVNATIAGTVKLQKCDDPDSVPDSAKTWFDITSSSQSFSATVNLNWAYADVAYRALRAVVAVTSGTVTAAIRVNGKGA